jgi:hypothetical protein
MYQIPGLSARTRKDEDCLRAAGAASLLKLSLGTRETELTDFNIDRLWHENGRGRSQASEE